MLDPSGPGVSFVELAIDLVLTTKAPLPCWKGGRWTVEAGPCTVVQLGAAGRLLKAVFKQMFRCINRPLHPGAVRSLGAYCYCMNSGRADGLRVRPLLVRQAQVAQSVACFPYGRSQGTASSNGGADFRVVGQFAV